MAKEPLFENIFTLIWLIGIAALMIYSVVMLLKLKEQLKGAVHDTEHIYFSANLVTPFVMGAIRPKIYLPLSLSETEKRYILLHEQTHIRRFDHLIKPVGFLVLCVHWFNPLVWAAFFLSGRDMEMSCDETVGELPFNTFEIGVLDSILHTSGSMPERNFQGAGLDEKYAGNRIFQSGFDDIIYLEDFEGFYSSFVKQSQNLEGHINTTSESTEAFEKTTPAQQVGLTFFVKPDETAQVIGETAANIWLKSYMGEDVSPTEQIANYTINAVTVIAGDSREGQSPADMEYHYVVRVNYDIITAFEEYFAPGDGVSEKGMFQGLYILAQIQNCYAQAINYKQLDIVPIIENLFDTLMFSPAGSSNPDDYIDAHRLDYRELTYYGDYTLRYIFSECIKGGQTGLKGRLMWIVMDDLIAGEGIPMAAESGQEYFDAWREHGQKKLSSIGEDEMRENYPKSYLMLTMLSDME